MQGELRGPALQARAQEQAQAAHAELESTRAALQQAQRSAADGQAALQHQVHQVEAQLTEGAAHTQGLLGQLDAARRGEAAQVEAVQGLQARVQELEGEAAARGQRVAGLERDLAELQVPSACKASCVFVCLSVLQQSFCKVGCSLRLECVVAGLQCDRLLSWFLYTEPDERAQEAVQARVEGGRAACALGSNYKSSQGCLGWSISGTAGCVFRL